MIVVVAAIFAISSASQKKTTNGPTNKLSKIPVSQIPLTKIERQPVSADRIFLVSDIHGRFDSFKKALSAVKFDKSDQLFVLGDTIDRGPDGFHALLYLTQTLPAEGYHVTVLTGDHEEMWLQIAGKGDTDTARLSALTETVDSYKGNVPNGWSASYNEWLQLTASERTFLLKEFADGFDQPHALIVNADGKWLSLSHTANFAKPLSEQTVDDLSWNNQHMRNAPVTYRQSVADTLHVPVSDTQVFIGHISNVLFGQQPNFIDLDDTPVFVSLKEFVATPVKIYELNDGKFYQ